MICTVTYLAADTLRVACALYSSHLVFSKKYSIYRQDKLVAPSSRQRSNTSTMHISTFSSQINFYVRKANNYVKKICKNRDIKKNSFQNAEFCTFAGTLQWVSLSRAQAVQYPSSMTIHMHSIPSEDSFIPVKGYPSLQLSLHNCTSHPCAATNTYN